MLGVSGGGGRWSARCRWSRHNDNALSSEIFSEPPCSLTISQDNALGEMCAMLADLMETAKTFFIALYGQPPGTSMESARFTFFVRRRKVPKTKPCLQYQPDPAHVAGQSIGHLQPHLTSQPISLSSAMRSGMTS